MQVIDDYLQLFVDDIPLIDVRAPVEFAQGAFPNATNLPLMNDAERQAVGLCYKQHGQQDAIALGESLVAGGLRTARIEQWAEFARRHPHGALYCFRGGLRSRICQQWLHEATGIDYPRIHGGYKALRRFLLDAIPQCLAQTQILVLGGRTGTGKTLLLHEIPNHIDLEKLYHHRGSAFGGHPTPQPTQIDIENSLAVELLRHKERGLAPLVLEDEAPNIGSRRLPQSLIDTLRTSPLLLLEADMETRVNNVFVEYIHNTLADYQALFGTETGFEHWAQYLTGVLEKIQRRLGNERYRELKRIMHDALRRQYNQDNADDHRIWIRILLEHYYDPMYDYQLQKKQQRIVFRGNYAAVLDYIRQAAAKPQSQ